MKPRSLVLLLGIGFAAGLAPPVVPVNAPKSSVIIGGGPSGLATAILLARRGWKDIAVYDRLPPPPDPNDSELWSDTARFYLIGLGGRGQKALKELDCWDEVEKYCTSVAGRRDWPPNSGPEEGVERIFTDRPYLTQVLPRDRLVGILRRILDTTYPQVKVFNGLECTSVAWSDTPDSEHVKLEFSRCDEALARTETGGTGPVVSSSAVSGATEDCAVDEEVPVTEVATPFLVGADGASRTVAHALETTNKKRFGVTRFRDDNVRVYKTVPLSTAKKTDWRKDINLSARSADGRVNFDALPADDRGSYVGVLLLKESDPLAQPDTDPALLRHELNSLLPQFSALIDDATLESVAAKPPSRLPSFRYFGPQLHRGATTLLLGDAVHTVKPYFGLGANSALEDVVALGKAFDATEGDKPGPALETFSATRGSEARDLVRISRGFDRPGALGFLTFILPIILDGIFHGSLPKVFAPNTIAMLQRDTLTFGQVKRRKRLDRALQVLVLSLGLGAVAKVTAMVLFYVPMTVQSALFKCALAFGAFKVAHKIVLSRNMAPADVLAKQDPSGTKSWDKSNEKFLTQ